MFTWCMWLHFVWLVWFYIFCFFFNDTATTEIYTYGHTLSLHDALPISQPATIHLGRRGMKTHVSSMPSVSAPAPHRTVTSMERGVASVSARAPSVVNPRSEEHTSELQSLMRISYAVFCLKKKKNQHHQYTTI